MLSQVDRKKSQVHDQVVPHFVNKNTFLGKLRELNSVMPPKSVKKEQKSSWNACDKCGMKVHQNKLKLHEECCDSPVAEGIILETFKTSSIKPSLPTEIETKDAPMSYLERFVFIPESICKFCNFTMRCNLLIEFDGKKYVRSSWTISDKHQDEVYCIAEGMMT